MSSGKAVFSARDLSSAAVKTGATATDTYTGPERRMADRRGGADRRTRVRFEIDGVDRRNNHGRRWDDPAPRPW